MNATLIDNFTLAQDGAVGLPGETAPAAPSPGADGSAPPRGDTGMQWFWPVLLIMIVVMIFMSSRGSRKEKKRREAMMSSLKKHDRVQTIGGVVGSIVELKPDFVVLKVDESSNTRITFARSAIQQVLESREDSAASANSD